MRTVRYTGTNMNVTASEEHQPEPGDHPENAVSRTWFCNHDRHGDCRGAVADSSKRSNWKCECACHDRARTKRHDWLDTRFDDEIELEHSAAHAPPLELTRIAALNGVAPVESANAGHWFSLGRVKITANRQPTSDSRWTLTCRCCPKSSRARRVYTRLFPLDAAERTPDWLMSPGHAVKLTTIVEPARLYRVGQCLECRTLFWFELVESVRK